MLQPNDVMSVSEENWEQFKETAPKDELYYSGPGDLLDTAEGRARFSALNETSVFQKPDPNFPGYKIWVFNVKGNGLVIKRRSTVDPAVMVNTEYDAAGNEVSKSYEPA